MDARNEVIDGQETIRPNPRENLIGRDKKRDCVDEAEQTENDEAGQPIRRHSCNMLFSVASLSSRGWRSTPRDLPEVDYITHVKLSIVCNGDCWIAQAST